MKKWLLFTVISFFIAMPKIEAAEISTEKSEKEGSLKNFVFSLSEIDKEIKDYYHNILIQLPSVEYFTAFVEEIRGMSENSTKEIMITLKVYPAEQENKLYLELDKFTFRVTESGGVQLQEVKHSQDYEINKSVR